MLVKGLGIIDFVGGIILFFGAGMKIPQSVLIILGIIFFVKAGIWLLKDFGSWVDFLSGLIFILLIFFQVPSVICIIFGVLLIQKGIFSFL